MNNVMEQKFTELVNIYLLGTHINFDKLVGIIQSPDILARYFKTFVQESVKGLKVNTSDNALVIFKNLLKQYLMNQIDEVNFTSIAKSWNEVYEEQQDELKG